MGDKIGSDIELFSIADEEENTTEDQPMTTRTVSGPGIQRRRGELLVFCEKRHDQAA